MSWGYSFYYMGRPVMKKKIAWMILAVCLVFAGSVNSIEAAKKPYIKVGVKSKVTVLAGKSVKLKAKTVRKKRKIKYSSSKKSVATVSSKGQVKAKKYGTAVISLRAKGMKTKKVKIYVKKPVKGLRVTSASRNNFYKKGRTAQIKASVTPSAKQVLSSVLSYKSSNTKVATVNSKGKITAKDGGYARIYISTSKKSGKVYSKYVEVFVYDGFRQVSTTTSGSQTIFTLNPAWKGVRVNFTSSKGKVYSYTIGEIKQNFEKLVSLNVPFAATSSQGVRVSKNKPLNKRLVNFRIVDTGENYDVVVDPYKYQMTFNKSLKDSKGKMKVSFQVIL